MNQIEHAAYKLVLQNVRDLRDFHPPRGAGIIISPKTSDIHRDQALKANHHKVPLERTPGWLRLAERGVFDDQSAVNTQFMRRLLQPLYAEGCKGDITLVADKKEAPDGFIRSVIIPAGVMGRQDVTVNGRTPNDYLQQQGWIESIRDPRPPRQGVQDAQRLKDEDRRTNIIYPLPLAMVLLEDMMGGDVTMLKAQEGRAHLISGNMTRAAQLKAAQAHPQHQTLQDTAGWDRMRQKGVFKNSEGHRAIDGRIAKAITCAACYQFAKQASDLIITANPKDEPEQGLMNLVIVPMLKNERAHAQVNGMPASEFLVKAGWVEGPKEAMGRAGSKKKPKVAAAAASVVALRKS